MRTGRFVADLHIHSRFSRATSQDLNPENLSLWAQKKGIAVVGTGDFTHPGWIAELRERLVEAEHGLYRLRPDLEQDIENALPASCRAPARFILTGEISCIYKRGEKTRKIHHLVLMPSFDGVARLNRRLERIGNVASDGRPILGLDSRNLLETVLEADERAFLIPAHVWTPWFSLFGSKSGFDAVEECFGDLTTHIHALETGLSSDPLMNRRWSALDNYVLVSNSDAHSPGKLGREASLFETDLAYDPMIRAMSDGRGFAGTIEFFPEEGKYHLDGHRKCRIRLEPHETELYSGLCPECGKPVTVGVLSRVHELSNRDEPRLTKPFFSVIPLAEILSELMACGANSKRVSQEEERLLSELGPELEILIHLPLGRIETAAGPLFAEAVHRMRNNRVIREGGYDGEYGRIRLFRDDERGTVAGQMGLFKPSQAEQKSPDKRPATMPLRIRKRKGGPPEPAGSSGAEDPILGPLNPEQRRAVLYGDGHVLVVAGPGTGKTLTLAHRIAYVIRTGMASPEQVLALTFTRKATREMRERVAALLGDHFGSSVTVSTFHGFCLDVLRKDGGRLNLPPEFTLCSEQDASALGRQIVSESKDGKRLGSAFLRALPLMKRAIALEEDDWTYEAVRPHFFAYQERLRAMGMLDLDDLEVESLRLFREHPEVCRAWAGSFPWVFVDEYQDTNAVQVGILKSLVGSSASCPSSSSLPPRPVRLFAIGDPDQAIYGFRGTDLKAFSRFEQDFPGSVPIVLRRNYRSTERILQAAATVMDKAEALETHLSGGPGITLSPCRTDREEAEVIVKEIERLIGGTSYFSLDSGRVASHEGQEAVAFGDIGILYRLNAQGDVLEEALNRAGIPCARSGQRSLIDRDPVRLLWRFFQAVENSGDAYYEKVYAETLAQSGKKPRGDLPAFRRGETMIETIDRAVQWHGLDKPTEEEDRVLGRLRSVAESKDGGLRELLDLLSLERGIDHELMLGDRVALMTLHAAKGLEWPVVFITGCEDGLLPCTLFGDRDDDEERRLFYVGMTRARRHLMLSYASRRSLDGRVLEAARSPFLDLIPKDLCTLRERRKPKAKRKCGEQLALFPD